MVQPECRRLTDLESKKRGQKIRLAWPPLGYLSRLCWRFPESSGGRVHVCAADSVLGEFDPLQSNFLLPCQLMNRAQVKSACRRRLRTAGPFGGPSHLRSTEVNAALL